MGSIWSTERGKIHSSSQLNEERGELTQDDSDSNCEEIFYETVDNVSSTNGETVLQEFETENNCIKESNETTCNTTCEVSSTVCKPEQKIPDLELGITSNINTGNSNTGTSKDSLLATEECEEKDQLPKNEKWTNSSWRVSPLLKEEDRVMECSTFSLPLILEEKVFRGNQVKSTSEGSDPEINSSHQVKPEIRRSCSWQVDVDCFKPKKRKKPPKKYLRDKERNFQDDDNDTSHRSAASDKQEVYMESCLTSTEIVTQEMMARRKVLDLRRW